MSDIAIKVENLGKSYLIGHNAAQPERYMALRDVITRNARNLARKTRDMLAGRAIVQGDEVEEFWALKEVSFEIKQGETVGIIGSNGAGKSTLLKILSRITEPTKGRISITGRMASLLEVGTGFHPELTGRENIFLNGAILGMMRAEINRSFDEIVAFAEVENFLDTPVKHYSSGMYVRLAFAVAAHMQPEILVVDEVLAVGDAAFQKKCIGKMGEVAQEGKTVLFVSHNMIAIHALCSKGILLSSGSIDFYGSAGGAIEKYIAGSALENFETLEKIPNRKGNGTVKFKSLEFIKKPQTGQPCEIYLTLTKPIPSRSARCSILFSDLQAAPILVFSTEISTAEIDFSNMSCLTCLIPRLPLSPGRYFLTLFLEVSGDVSDWIDSALEVNVHHGSYYGTARNLPNGWNHQMALSDHRWFAS
jgi:lipopolysaccharide transport system ATP-binding protein